MNDTTTRPGDQTLRAVAAEIHRNAPSPHPWETLNADNLALYAHHPTHPRRGLLTVAAVSILVAGLGGLGLLTARRATEPVGRTDTTPTATQPYTAVVRPVDKLLYPTATATGEPPQLTVADLNEGQQAMVQAPDGTLYRVGVSEKGGYVPDFAANSRDIGNHQVVAGSDGQSVGYSWTDGCVVISVTTADDGPTWAPERIALLESFTVADGGVGLDLAEGWNVIDHGSNAPLAQLSYAVKLDGVAHPVVLGQSIGASIAAIGSPMGPMEPVTLLDGTPAWFEPDSGPAPRLSFTRDGVAIWIWGDGLTADELVAAAALLAPAPDTWSSLLTDGAEVAPTGTVPPGGAPDLCGTPKLTIGT